RAGEAAPPGDRGELDPAGRGAAPKVVSGIRGEPEHTQLPVAAAGTGHTRGPIDGRVARGKLQHGEAAGQRRLARIGALAHGTIGPDPYRRYGRIDSATEDIHTSRLDLLDHGVR